MFGVKHATLCLLITYHWHGSWAVSAWPSGRDGIATEVNGSPTDAPVNIPVVKRSSNQADFANELPSRLDVVVDDSHEDRGEFNVRGPFEVAHREYTNGNVKKHTESMIHMRERRKIMIGASLDDNDQTKIGKSDKKLENVENEREEERKKFDVGPRWIKTLIPRKDVVTVVQLIGRMNPSTVKNPPSFLLSKRLSDYDLTSASHKNKRRNDQIHPVNFSGVKVISKPWKKYQSSVQVNNRKIMRDRDELENDFGTFVVGGRGEKDLTMLSRSKRETLPVDNSRIDTDVKRTVKQRMNYDKTVKDYELNSRLSNESSLLSDSKFTEHVRMLEERSEPNDTSLSITSSNDVNKVRETGRLHQQSRNTKPRTIIRHLRGIIKRQIGAYGDEPKLTRSYAERRQFGRITSTDPRKRRQLTNQRIGNFPKFNGNSQQLRFIPSYNNYGKNSKYFSSQTSRDRYNNELVPLTQNGELTSGNFRKLPKFEARQIDQLRKSISGVFDRPSLINEKDELPNVRTIPPKQIFVTSPKLIYDTKILPAPFSFPSYFQNSDNNDNDDDNNNNNNNREKMGPSALPINGVFDQKEMGENLERPGISMRENSQQSVEGLRNFVTPLPPYTGEVSLPVNHRTSIPLDSTFMDELYQVREIEQEDEMRNPSVPTGIQEYETFQREEDETSLNEKSPRVTGANDHSGNVRSSYDNSVSTYANHAESGPGNVHHSTDIGETINDEYLNHQTTRYGEVANIETDIRMSHISLGGQDDNDDRGRYKWRGKYDDDNARYAAKYSFGYRVSDDETQNDFGHQETRDEGITRGRYHVRLPDGRTQKVNYHVDDKGYHAIVSYHRDNFQ